MAAYDVNQKPGETLEKYYRRLAKTADQRLVRLEQQAQKESFNVKSNLAYKRAMLDIKKWSDGKAPKVFRFNINMPKDPEKLLAKIGDIKTFLMRPTSTKKGINIYKRSTNTINSRYKTSFTWEQMAKYFDNGIADKWEKTYGSKTALRVIGALQKNRDKFMSEMERVEYKDLDLEGTSNVVKSKIKELLAKNDLTFKELL